MLVGTQRGIEMRLVPQAGLPLETLRVAGLKGKGGTTLAARISRCSAPAMCGCVRRVSAEAQAGRGIRRRRIRGGADAAGDVAARDAQRDLRAERGAGLHQPGAGATFARDIATGYEVSARTWGEKAVVTGCPVRAGIFLDCAARAARSRFVC